jgi:serine/threonine protein kinase
MDNETIGHYRVIRLLGKGGMGVVYEAEDGKLGRRVALKFLQETGRAEPTAMERFFREARSASALNHPGICTIYAIEEHEGRTYIAMELLEGQSLDKAMDGGGLSISRSVEIGIEVADALDAAHKKSIIHRDIKPANIFITDRSTIKLLDFGLAKLMEPEGAGEGETMAELETAFRTNPGTAVGTIAYMSPEQARGEVLDPRSDLFSLGAVIYQMVTGTHPFPGSTTAVIFGNILHSAPVSPIDLNNGVPTELERILNKLLEKDRELRYQVAAELRADLKRLHRELEPGRPGSDPNTRASGAISGMARVPSNSTARAAKVSSGSVLVEAAQRNKLSTGLLLTVAALLVAAAGYGAYAFLHKTGPLPFEKFTIENVSNNGKVSQAAISPDGKYLLEALEEKGLQSLWLHHIPTNSNTEVLKPAATRYSGLQFSPDGNYIYFLRQDEDEEDMQLLYSASVLGGAPRMIIRDVDSPITFSPDGQHFAFVRERHEEPTVDLLMAKTDGSIERTIAAQQSFKTDSLVPAWSPDGKEILIPVDQPTKNALGGFASFDVASGKQETVGIVNDRIYYTPSWMPGGKAVVVATTQPGSGTPNVALAMVTLPSGEVRVLTTDTNDYIRPMPSVDGRLMVATQRQVRQEFSVTDAGTPSEWHPLTLQSRQTFSRGDWLPDGRLVVPQGADIRVIDPKGTETVVLSDAKHVADQLAVCGDGAYIVYRPLGKNGQASVNLWIMRSDGSEQKELIAGQNHSDPSCPGDGKWAYYLDRDDRSYLKRVSVPDGKTETVIEKSVGGYAISEDGKKILIGDVRPFDHKEMWRVLDVETRKAEYYEADQRMLDGATFSPDGKNAVYVVREKGVDNLWTRLLEGGAPRQLTQFPSELIFGYRYSRNGKKLAVIRGHVESDAVLFHDVGR